MEMSSKSGPFCRLLLSSLILTILISSTAPLAAIAAEVDTNTPPVTIAVDEASIITTQPDAPLLDSPENKICFANTDDKYRLQELTNKILQKELELLKVNTYFRLETTDQSRFKPWRIFAFNLAGAGVANAGITTIAAERWQTWRNPATADRTTLKAGPLLLLVSHSIVTAGLLTEMCFDAYGDYKRKKKGLDIKTTTKKVKQNQVELDNLITQRDELIASSSEFSSQDLLLVNAEGRLLKDLRDLSLVEYSKFYARGIKRRISRDLSYFNGLAAATTGGYIGSLCGLLAICERKPQLAGPAGIGFTLSGAFICLAPFINRYGSTWAQKIARKKINKELGNLNTKVAQQFEGDLTALRTLNTNAEYAALGQRLSVYDGVRDILTNQSKMDAAEKKKADREFLERVVFNGGVGGTKMAWGIQLANAGFSYHTAPPWPRITRTFPVGGSRMTVVIPRPTIPHTPNQMFAKRVAEGSTSYIPGTGLWIIDALQARTRGEMEVFSMGSQQALPHQKCRQRLEKLENLQAILK